MVKVAIIGKQQPRKVREHMCDMIKDAGFFAELLDMETRNTADFKEQLKGYHALITAGEKIPAETMNYLKEDLKLISRYGIETDEIDHKAATEYGIAICNAAGSSSAAVAECAIELMINLLRNFPKGDAEVRKDDWSRFFESKAGNQLEGKTVGLIGFGDIAKVLAKMLYGFDCKVIAYDLDWDAETARQYEVSYATMEEIQKRADIISLHVPATPVTTGMINLEFLKGMKPTAILINTGRGALVVENDLVYALENNIIAAAGLDVFEKEPLPISSPLIKLDNVMPLPHSGAGSVESSWKAGKMTAENVIAFFQGKTVKTILNPDYIKFVGTKADIQ